MKFELNLVREEWKRGEKGRWKKSDGNVKWSSNRKTVKKLRTTTLLLIGMVLRNEEMTINHSISKTQECLCDNQTQLMGLRIEQKDCGEWYGCDCSEEMCVNQRMKKEVMWMMCYSEFHELIGDEQ